MTNKTVKGEAANYDVEFDFRVLGDGRSALARYANNSNYRNDSLIRKESKTFHLHCATIILTISKCALAPL